MHGDRASVRVTGRDHRGRPVGRIVEVLERAQRRIVGRAARASTASPSSSPRTGASRRTSGAAGEAGQRQARPGRHRRAGRSRRPSTRSPIGRVAEVLGNYADPGHGDRDRAAQVRPAARVLRRKRSRRRRRCRVPCAKRTLKAAATCASCRSSPSTARRRRTSTTRSTRGAKGKRLPPVGGDRRRQPLRAPRRRARPRRRASAAPRCTSRAA